MEFIYFTTGVILATGIYVAIYLRKIYNKTTHLGLEFEDLENSYLNLNSSFTKYESEVLKLRKQMESDSYEGLNQINIKVETHNKVLDDIDSELSRFRKQHEENLSKVHSVIQNNGQQIRTIQQTLDTSNTY